MDAITRADVLAEKLGITPGQVHRTIEGNRLRTVGRQDDLYLIEADVAEQITAIYRNAAEQDVQTIPTPTPEHLRGPNIHNPDGTTKRPC